MIYFDWDLWKAAENLRDHDVDFSDARAVFWDLYRLTEEDSVEQGEQRWRTIGTASGITVLLVFHLEEDFQGDLYVRMISARKATSWERNEYEENRANDIGRTAQS